MTLAWDTDGHAYQHSAADHLVTRAAAALWLSPGYGKTAAALHAFKKLKDAGKARNMLVVAPLRVVQTVWENEIASWSSLEGLHATKLHGPKKAIWLKQRDVNVWLINYEGLPWLTCGSLEVKNAPHFDVVVFDEIRRLKNSRALRFRAALPLARKATWRWGLTGTPASNGLMDLFGQFLILDGGAALGSRLTRFRRAYFEQGYDGFSWLPRPGAAKTIEDKLAPLVFRAEGKLDLPVFVHDKRSVVLDDKARKIYTTMKGDLITRLGSTVITAANAAVLVGKLKQMANGRVYDEAREIHVIHSAKQDALRELIDELGDEQLLIAYEFNHDLAQIREVLGDDVPYIGGGVGETAMQDRVAAWNRREIQFLAAHPASAGHGINLQRGGAHHILWWGPTFDLDHYIQFNDRLCRQGNTADSVVVHVFVAEHTVDETAVKSRDEKDTLQSALLKAMAVEFGDTIHVQKAEEAPMKLTFKSDVETALAEPQQANPFQQAAPVQQGANPFQQAAPVQQGANPFQQAAAIMQDVAAPPPMRPEQAFEAFGVSLPAMPVETPPEPERVAGADLFQQVAAQEPEQGTAAFAVQDAPIKEASPAPQGMVPVYTWVPESAVSAVLAAIARAVKK